MTKATKTTVWTIVAAAIIAGAIFAHRPVATSDATDAAATAEQSQRRVSVELAQLKPMMFEERVELAATVEPRNTALVSARIPGTLDAIFVDEGDTVSAGQTQLFQTDKLALQKALDAAEREVDVAAAAVRASEATVERVKADLTKARIDYERFKRLYERDKAVTANALETQQSRFEQTTAALAEAKASLDLSKARRRQADSGLAIARKDLADTLVLAPINGTISERMLEPGEMAGAGMVVVRIDDPTELEIVASMPESYYGRVRPGETSVRLFMDGADLGEHPVSYKSPTVDPQFRTFDVKVLLADAPAGVVAGRLARMDVIVGRSDGVGVPLDAVLTRGGRSVIFVADAGCAKLAPVKVGLQTEGWLQVISDALDKGATVVTRGQRFCDDGVAISIVKGDR